MSKLRSLSVAVVFLAGCAVGGASARFVVPPVNAQQATALVRWQYFCTQLSAPLVDETVDANALGEKSWELVTLDVTALGAQRACFKRPKM